MKSNPTVTALHGPRARVRFFLALTLASAAAAACDGGAMYSTAPFRVGTVTFDPDLPPEPLLPTDDQVCSTLEASDKYVKRPDGALPPEADPSPPGAGVAADPAVVNPDQARIQAALDACGAAVDAEVGAAIAQVDSDATAAQMAAGDPNLNIAGALGRGARQAAVPRARSSRSASRSAAPGAGRLVHQRPAHAALGGHAVARYRRHVVRDARRGGVLPEIGRSLLREHRRQRHQGLAARAIARHSSTAATWSIRRSSATAASTAAPTPRSSPPTSSTR